MKFTVIQGALRSALSVALKGAADNASMPIVAGVLVRAEERALEFQTTDLSVSVRLRIPADVEEPGETVVPGKMLAGVVKNLPNLPVSFEGAGRSVRVSCERTSFNLNTLDPKDFPEFPEVAPESSVELPGALLREMADRSCRVASKDATRPMLCGVLLEVENGLARAVATDSYRLAVTDARAAASSLEGSFSAVVPADAFKDAVAVTEGAETVTVGVSGAQAVFRAGGVTYVSRRLEGSFPNWAPLLPKGCTTSVELDMAAFSDALRRVSAVVTANPSVVLDVDAGAGLVTLSARSADAADAREQLDAKVVGDSVRIALNHRYVGDCAAAMGNKGEATLELQGPVQPAVFKACGEVDYLCLVMPVRI